MGVLRLETDVAELTLSTQGAAVLGWRLKASVGGVPLLRPARHAGGGPPDEAAAFPLVPYGNRIGGNAFSFAGRDYRVTPNAGDRYRLHGDGWLSDWTVEAATAESATLALRRAADAAAPWDYLARQTVTLDGRRLTVALSVENTGDAPLPFGLGWHPYFPLTPRMRLTAPSSSVWLEGADYLPTEDVPLPPDLDFRRPAPLPNRWINNGFEDWNGCARIDWPERGLTLLIDADPIFSRYVLYRPDAARDPAYCGDWFCFEPMTHTVNAFRLDDLGGLRPLAPGTRIEGTLRLTAVVK
ncbi:aldose 1-epimerase [Pleomorphomonas koreensis]|uniref:aldose 1-epimerase n=1 Tax=Pleomorphomonas koreensis TaxID=257440 RepID=UPI000429B336|nr:aldose 1-epimerase [Pleomorphomonas koreensis]